MKWLILLLFLGCAPVTPLHVPIKVSPFNDSFNFNENIQNEFCFNESKWIDGKLYVSRRCVEWAVDNYLTLVKVHLENKPQVIQGEVDWSVNHGWTVRKKVG